jgi:hypothetical protein
MTTTRERLERRWSPGRVALLVGGLVAVLLLVGAALALWWLPPVLAETPRERFTTDARITVHATSHDDDDGSDSEPTATDAGASGRGIASVIAAAGWVELGVGPFLPDETVTLLSPDGVYRAELGATTSAPDEALPALLARHDLASAAASAGWSEETLTSSLVVRHTELDLGADTVTVAIVSPSAAALVPSTSLLLVATVPTTDAARYRTVTADLLSTATLDTPVPAVDAPSPDSGSADDDPAAREFGDRAREFGSLALDAPDSAGEPRRTHDGGGR